MSNFEFDVRDDAVLCNGKRLKGISPEGFKRHPEFERNSHNDSFIVQNIEGVWWLYLFRNGLKHKFLTADSYGFKIINKDFAVDSTHVFLIAKDGFAIPGSDGPSFRVFEDTPYFSADKNQLYALSSSSGLKICDVADTDSLVSLGWSSDISDHFNIYSETGNAFDIVPGAKFALHNYQDRNQQYALEQAKGGKLSREFKFERNRTYLYEMHPGVVGWWHEDYSVPFNFFNDFPLGYHICDHGVFFVSDGGAIRLHHADPSTFRALNGHYGSDDKMVFCNWRRVHQADPASFAIKDQLGPLFGQDDDGLYFNGNRIDCDVESFSTNGENPIGLRFRGQDKHKFFKSQVVKYGKVGMRTDQAWSILPITNSSPTTFTQLNQYWSKDAGNVYLGLDVMPKANPITFEVLSASWARDDLFLYDGSRQSPKIKGIDPQKLKVLSEWWAKTPDGIFSFLTGKLQPKIDLDSFEVMRDGQEARDEHFDYSISFGSIKKRKRRSL